MHKSIALLVAISFIAFSQLNAQVMIGFRSGVHAAANNLTFDLEFQEYARRERITSLTVGIPVEWPAGRMLSFHSGLQIQRMGTRVVKVDRSRGFEDWLATQYNITYLSIPSLAKLSLPMGRLQVFILGGINFHYGIDLENSTYSYTDGGINERWKMDFARASIRRYDASLALGAGLQTQISEGKIIFVDFRTSTGLLDIDTRDSEAYNQAFEITLGMLLPMRKRS